MKHPYDKDNANPLPVPCMRRREHPFRNIPTHTLGMYTIVTMSPQKENDSGVRSEATHCHSSAALSSAAELPAPTAASYTCDSYAHIARRFQGAMLLCMTCVDAHSDTRFMDNFRSHEIPLYIHITNPMLAPCRCRRVHTFRNLPRCTRQLFTQSIPRRQRPQRSLQRRRRWPPRPQTYRFSVHFAGVKYSAAMGPPILNWLPRRTREAAV